MGKIFDLIRKKEKNSVDRLWELYANGELEKRNYEAFVLCEYESGVEGEGHGGYFFNEEGCLESYNEVLKKILPADFYRNYDRAFRALNTESEDVVCEEADEYFYEHEQEILDLAYAYSRKL